MSIFGEVFPIAEDRSVPLPLVEQELRRLWIGTGTAASDTEAPVTRVCTLNLVIVAPDARSASRASEAGAAITARYPCRVIAATTDRSGPDGLEASISAYCHGGAPGDKPICCERISLYSSGAAVRQLPWAITPLLAPDVPVFLWMPGDIHPEEELFKHLRSLADRLIVDLQSASRPAELARSLLQATPNGRPAPSDLAWGRTAFWREIVATALDPPAYRRCLSSLTRLEIGYTPGGVGWPQAQAALLGLWIAGCLGWKPQGAFNRDGARWTVPVLAPAGPGEILLLPNENMGTAPGDICSVHFPSTAPCTVSFQADRLGNGELVEMNLAPPDAAPMSWRRPMASFDTTWLLGQELERLRCGPLFLSVLSLLAPLI